MKFYRDWEEPARADRSDKAVSAPFRMRLSGGKVVKAEIVKPLHGDGMIYYAGSKYPIRRAKPAEVDRIRRWKTFSNAG